jgi:acetyl-CoA carboxylase carboxyl transferase subunit alpha
MTPKSNKGKANAGRELSQIEDELDSIRKKAYENLSPWQTVQVARHEKRPTLDDYIEGIFTDFIELHGDRCFGDDQGIMGGFATLKQKRVMVIGHRKGKTVEENVARNFGMATPDGYRKALRLMKLAEKYNLPVVSFIDTPGAYPGLDAEARGQAEAIARNLTEMAALEVPIVVVVTGEGGSGGALGIGVGDVVLMLSHSVYSVISPEGCAAILWHDGSKAPDAAEALRLTADDLLEFKIIDEIIPEPAGGAHRAQADTLNAVSEALSRHLTRLARVNKRKLVDSRMEKYFKIGRPGSRGRKA